MQLNILDQCPIPEGSGTGDALRNSIELARLADRLGYGRYWLAEHHGTPGLACNSPEVMIGPVAAATSRIHVGSGGVMLPHYSPLKVAENFSMLAALFPGRIDLGIGRAPGTSSQVAFCHSSGIGGNPYRMISGIRWTNSWVISAKGNRGVRSESRNCVSSVPEVSLLGSSPQMRRMGGRVGTTVCVRGFHQSRRGRVRGVLS